MGKLVQRYIVRLTYRGEQRYLYTRRAAVGDPALARSFARRHAAEQFYAECVFRRPGVVGEVLSVWLEQKHDRRSGGTVYYVPPEQDKKI